jgi:hypothetical protein
MDVGESSDNEIVRRARGGGTSGAGWCEDLIAVGQARISLRPVLVSHVDCQRQVLLAVAGVDEQMESGFQRLVRHFGLCWFGFGPS